MKIVKTESLIDAATVVPDGVIRRTELPDGRGFRYVFADRVLPRWFIDAAKSHKQGFVLVDNDAGGKRRGRDVSLEIPERRARIVYSELPADHIFNSR